MARFTTAIDAAGIERKVRHVDAREIEEIARQVAEAEAEAKAAPKGKAKAAKADSDEG